MTFALALLPVAPPDPSDWSWLWWPATFLFAFLAVSIPLHLLVLFASRRGR